MLDKILRVAKALVAGVFAAGAALVPAIGDQVITANEVWAIVGAFIATAYAVWQTPNKKAPVK